MKTNNIPVKRNTSEEVANATSVVVDKSDENSDNVNESVEEETVKHPVFPVKSVLKRSEDCFEAIEMIDKENVNPAEGTVDWDDLDAEDMGDPMMVSDYVVEIFEYLFKLEVES